MKLKTYFGPRGKAGGKTLLDSESIRVSLEKRTNEMIRESPIGRFWEFCMDPFDLYIDPSPVKNGRPGIYINIGMTTPRFYLSPLAGAPC